MGRSSFAVCSGAQASCCFAAWTPASAPRQQVSGAQQHTLLAGQGREAVSGRPQGLLLVCEHIGFGTGWDYMRDCSLACTTRSRYQGASEPRGTRWVAMHSGLRVTTRFPQPPSVLRPLS